MKPVDEYVADFVKGISRLKVVEAKTIMMPIDQYQKNYGELSNNAIKVSENEILSKLIEYSVKNDAPIIVQDKNLKDIGAISQKDLLKAAVEGQDD